MSVEAPESEYRESPAQSINQHPLHHFSGSAQRTSPPVKPIPIQRANAPIHARAPRIPTQRQLLVSTPLVPPIALLVTLALVSPIVLIVPAAAIAAFGLPPLVRILLLLFLVLELVDGLLGVENLVAYGTDEHE